VGKELIKGKIVVARVRSLALTCGLQDQNHELWLLVLVSPCLQISKLPHGNSIKAFIEVGGRQRFYEINMQDCHMILLAGS
jgi:hypothetical protein